MTLHGKRTTSHELQIHSTVTMLCKKKLLHLLELYSGEIVGAQLNHKAEHTHTYTHTHTHTHTQRVL